MGRLEGGCLVRVSTVSLGGARMTLQELDSSSSLLRVNMDRDWQNVIDACTKENLIKPPFGRSVHLIDDKYVCKITNGEVDSEEYNYVPRDKYPLIKDILARDANEVLVLAQISGCSLVPRVLYHREGVTILEYIPGNTLMEIWKCLTEVEKKEVKRQVRDVIKKLSEMKIETHSVKLDSMYNLCFEGERKFLHSDLNLDNIIVRDKKLVGLIDWEYSGNYNIQVVSKINKDMCDRGRSLKLEVWSDLFDNL